MKGKEYYTVKVSRRKVLYGGIAVGAAAVGAAADHFIGQLGKDEEKIGIAQKESATPSIAIEKPNPTPTLETSTATIEPTQTPNVILETPTAEPTAFSTTAAEEAGNQLVQEQMAISEALSNGEPIELFRAEGAKDYPLLQKPDPEREPVFPDVEKGERAPLVAYEEPFESGDYFHDGKGDVDIPQYYYRVITAGKIKIDQLGIDCSSGSKEKGYAAIIINHFGDTAMFEGAEVNSGFTVAGRVFDMSTPEKVTEAGQALLDHYLGRMTESEDGANCGTISACPSVEWHVVVIGNGKPQVHWAGVYTRPETK
jgi:hypothetical protein